MLETLTLETEKVHFEEIFGRKAPVEVEIGCGKGKFLLARSQAEPGTDFLGIDYAGKWMKIGKQRGEKRKLPNLVFLKTEASELVFRIPEASVSVFHIYFPDPWPKRRHKRRRLINGAFMEILKKRLVPGGFIHIATDNEDYYKQISEAAHSVKWEKLEEAVNRRLCFPEIKTNYELKYEAEGRPLYYLEARP